jgi:hypothetical protein
MPASITPGGGCGGATGVGGVDGTPTPGGGRGGCCCEGGAGARVIVADDCGGGSFLLCSAIAALDACARVVSLAARPKGRFGSHNAITGLSAHKTELRGR